MTPSKKIITGILIMITFPVFAQDQFSSITFLPDSQLLEQDSLKAEYPDPNSVLRKSLFIPGWGQITNKQAWKVPIVYGLIGGLTYYSIDLTVQYHDYRAAYYNQYSGNTDLKFGATPDFLAGQNRQTLKNNRDFLRNRRDFIYVTIALSYLLNAIDAYVFAHLRSFDVSDDLTMNHSFEPALLTSPEMGDIPGLTLKFSF